MDDWPATGVQTATLAVAMYSSRYSGTLAAQFVVNNPYFAERFLSAVPQHNLTHQEVQAGYGGSNALQTSLKDGKRTVSPCSWFDTQSGKPSLTADSKVLPNHFLLTRSAQPIIRADETGAYTFELSMPWTALGRSILKRGDTWKVTFQPWRAVHDPEFTVSDTHELKQRGALTFKYTAREWRGHHGSV